MNILRQVSRKLSYHNLRMLAFSYGVATFGHVTKLLVTPVNPLTNLRCDSNFPPIPLFYSKKYISHCGI